MSFKVIENFKIDPKKWDFLSLTQAEEVHDRSFQLKGNVWINFDSDNGGNVAISAIRPEVSAPYYRIRPINMGASAWYSIECELPGDQLNHVGQIVPCLDAASAQSVTLFALLRIFYKDGRSEDISSSQVELRRDRTRQSFPISLGDLPTLDQNAIDSARLIYFIEARNVDVDIYGMTIATIAAPEAPYSVDHVERLRAAQKAGMESLHVRSLNPQIDTLWIGEASEHRPITTEIFLDFQPGGGRRVMVARQSDALDIDFSQTASGEWRNLEFRFDQVFNSGSISAVLHAKGRSGLQHGWDVTLVLREYDGDLAWEDTHISVPLSLFPQGRPEPRIIDLSPLLSDKRDTHRFGIMAFLPPETGILQIEEMDVFVFDRELV